MFPLSAEGGPWFPDYRSTDYAKEWFDELKARAPEMAARSS